MARARLGVFSDRQAVPRSVREQVTIIAGY
jgi:hypothetical protein